MSTFAEPIGQFQGARRGRTAANSRASLLASRLRSIGNAAIITAIAIVPLTSASLQESGIALFVAASLLLGLTWAIEQITDRTGTSGASGAEVIGLSAIALVSLQLIPLPESLLQRLAPFTSTHLPLWGTETGRILGTGGWSTVSMTPSLTRSGLILLIGYVIFFLALLQRIRSMEDIRTLIRLICLGTVLMAAIGVAQLLSGSHEFLWMFEHPFRTASWPAKGAFSNQNHFAHFLALGLGPLIWWWQDSIPRQEKVVRGSTRTTGFGLTQSRDVQHRWLTAAIALVLLAVVLSFSRGGILAVGTAGVISATIIRAQWKQKWKWVVGTLVFVFGAAWLFGTEQLQSKIAAIENAGSIEELLAGRYALWNAIREALASFWLTGSGIGSHAEVYPTWLDQDFGVRFSHAECGYLQLFLEAGIGGLVLLGGAFLLVLSWIHRAYRHSDGQNQKLVVVISAGLAASALHSAVDFVWYIPGCMLITLTLLACLCRCAQLNSPATDSNRPERTPIWPRVFAWSLILVMVPVGRLSADVAFRDAATEWDWNQYRHHAIAAGDNSGFQSLEALDTQLDTIIMHLERCISRDPTDFRAASDLSAMYLRRFERHQAHADNQVNTREIRSTVRSADFGSARDVAEWLNRAFGSDAADLYRALSMAKKAVRGQPLRGETYLVLAEVGFLAGMSEQEEEAFLQQALRLRPHKAGVLFVAGISHAEDGNLDLAMDVWKTAFQKDPAIRTTIVQGLAPYLPARDVIDELQPDLDGLSRIFAEYRKQDRPEDLKIILQEFERKFESFLNDPDRDRLFWPRCYEFFEFSGNREKARGCLVQAVRESPHDYPHRKKLGLLLVRENAKQEALTQLEWCEVRKPDDREVTEALKSLRSEYRGEVNHAE